jgi:hypothetical protein
LSPILGKSSTNPHPVHKQRLSHEDIIQHGKRPEPGPSTEICRMNRVIAQTTSLATAVPRAHARLRKMIGANLHALGFRLGAAARAHERRQRFEAVGEDTMGDLGMAPDTATGLSGWEADLPFFMQSGFHRR